VATLSERLGKARIWAGHRLSHGNLRMECTDSLGVPVVMLSDGVERIMVAPSQIAPLIRMLRDAESRAALALGRVESHADLARA
jgi:hypothetical protein